MNTNIHWNNAIWGAVLTGTMWAAVVLSPAPAYAQKPSVIGSAIIPDVGSKSAKATAPEDQDLTMIDAQRGAMDRFLDSHPEIASEVVDNPSALIDPNYLKDHAAMQAFLESHPMVKADPRAFISPRNIRIEPDRSELGEFMNDLAPLAAFGGALLAILWIIRTLLENRRWNRSFKMHEEIHAKLIDKFASGQDFNAYMQSEGGRRLLEWTPPATGTGSRGLPNPIGRIFWSVQAGLVLALMGLGMLLLRNHMTPHDAPPLLVFGTLGLTLGAGFILSALISYGLSRHLGLIDPSAQGSPSMVK
jgi:hypothetical protein